MTEKRYYVVQMEGIIYPIYFDGDKELDGEEVCDLLNNYEKENEQLKSTNMEYEDALGRLEEENEQLKAFIQKEFPESYKHILEGLDD